MRIRERLIEAQVWSSTDAADPEEDLLAAWRLSEQLRDAGWTMLLTNRVHARRHEDGPLQHHAEYRVDLSHPQIAIDRAGNSATGYGPTAAMAICHAVLAALPYLQRMPANQHEA